MKWGSRLILHPDVNITLADTGCYIEFEPNSTIEFVNGATFTFSGNGYLLINGALQNELVKFEGSNGILLLNGTNKNDKKLEFKRLDSFRKNIVIPNTLHQLVTNNCKIQSDCIVKVNSKSDFTNTKIRFTSDYIEFNDKTKWTNTDIECDNTYLNADADINGGLVHGSIIATNINEGNDVLKIDNTHFNSLDGNGLYVYNSRNELSNLTFTSQDKPMRFYAMSFPTVLDRVLIHNHANVGTPASGGRGIVYEGASNGSELHLKGSNVLLQNMNGITVDNAQLSLECSKVTGNSGLTATHGIVLSNGASLIADPSIVNNAGKNDLSGYKNTILCDDALDIQIHNGYTSLVASVNDAFEGNILTEYIPNTDQFLAHHNHWKWNGAPTRTNHYYTFLDGANRQFGVGGNVNIDGSNYLTAIPNLENLCPETNQGGGGSGGDKHSGYVMNNPTLLAAKHHELNLNSSYETLLDRVFNPTLNLTHTARIDAATELLKRPVSNDATMKTATLLVYQKMLNHHAALLAQNTITFGKNSPEMDQLLNTQMQLMSNTSWSNEQRFKLEMDKVFTHRASGNLSRAMLELNALASKYENKATYINKWICTLQNEIDLKAGNVTVQEFVHRTNQCSTSYTQSTHVFNKPNESSNEIFNTIADVIKVYPNPAQRHLSLKLDGGVKETLRIEIKDMLGKTVMTTDCKVENSLITMSIEQLPFGIYTLVCDEISLQTKFSVVK